MVVGQLFTLEEFMPIADSFALPGISGGLFAFLSTILAIFSLPFLLRMDLSVAFRWLSAGCLAGFVSLWAYASVFVMFVRNGHVDSLGFVGGIGSVAPGTLAIGFVFVLAVMAGWSIWGLWPARRSSG